MICVKVVSVVSPTATPEDLPKHTVDVPCSKYMANRLLVIAALARGRSVLRGVPQNDDMTATVRALQALQQRGGDGDENHGGRGDETHGGDNNNDARRIGGDETRGGNSGDNSNNANNNGNKNNNGDGDDKNFWFEGDSVTIQGADGCFDHDLRRVYTSDNGTLSRIMAPLLLLSRRLNFRLNSQAHSDLHTQKSTSAEQVIPASDNAISANDSRNPANANANTNPADEGCILSGSEQMNARPMKDLFDAMQQLGAEIVYHNKEGYLPVKIGGRYQGGECFLSGSVSSQYFSALLLSAPYAENDVIIRATSPLISFSYVEMTMQCMREAGAEVRYELSGADSGQAAGKVGEVGDAKAGDTSSAACELGKAGDKSGEQAENSGLPSFYVVGGRKKVYQGFEKTIETDPTAASYFMAMSALRFMRLEIKHFPRHSVQGEALFYQVLQKMGCECHFSDDQDSCTLEMIPPAADYSYPSHFEFDVQDMTDIGPTILVLAVALGHLHGVETNIRGVAHLRYKESNRVEGMSGELRKIGAKIDIGAENIRVLPVKLDAEVARKTPLNSLGDHRLVMSFSLLSLITGCVFIENEESVNKTFPHFFDVLKKLGFECTLSEEK